MVDDDSSVLDFSFFGSGSMSPAQGQDSEFFIVRFYFRLEDLISRSEIMHLQARVRVRDN